MRTAASWKSSVAVGWEQAVRGTKRNADAFESPTLQCRIPIVQNVRDLGVLVDNRHTSVYCVINEHSIMRFSLSVSPGHWLTDWLTDWLIDWLIDWHHTDVRLVPRWRWTTPTHTTLQYVAFPGARCVQLNEVRPILSAIKWYLRVSGVSAMHRTRINSHESLLEGALNFEISNFWGLRY